MLSNPVRMRCYLPCFGYVESACRRSIRMGFKNQAQFIVKKPPGIRRSGTFLLPSGEAQQITEMLLGEFKFCTLVLNDILCYELLLLVVFSVMNRSQALEALL